MGGIYQSMTCFRYLFLGLMAYIYLKGYELKRLWPFILPSAGYSVYMLYSETPTWMNRFIPDGWSSQTAFAYFYTLLVFVILTNACNKIQSSSFKRFILFCGRNSWLIFCAQMVLLGTGLRSIVSYMCGEGWLYIGVLVVATLMLSLAFAWGYEWGVKKVMKG